MHSRALNILTMVTLLTALLACKGDTGETGDDCAISCSSESVTEQDKEQKKPLKAGGVLEFVFEELPNTFHGKCLGKTVSPRLLASLPQNYTKEGTFPLLVHLGGGDGGGVTREQLDYVRILTADRDFIAVSMSLFKKEIDPKEVFGGQLIGAYDDYPLISRCYRKMLQTLFDAVPNIDPKRSTLGGFSNGAHATALLVGALDPFILKHFSSFYLLDGGFHIPSFHKMAVREKRFIYFVGGSRNGKLRPHLLDRLDATVGPGWAPNVTVVKMPDVEHAFPAQYIPQLRSWITETKEAGQDAPADSDK